MYAFALGVFTGLTVPAVLLYILFLVGYLVDYSTDEGRGSVDRILRGQ